MLALQVERLPHGLNAVLGPALEQAAACLMIKLLPLLALFAGKAVARNRRQPVAQIHRHRTKDDRDPMALRLAHHGIKALAEVLLDLRKLHRVFPQPQRLLARPLPERLRGALQLFPRQLGLAAQFR